MSIRFQDNPLDPYRYTAWFDDKLKSGAVVGIKVVLEEGRPVAEEVIVSVSGPLIAQVASSITTTDLRAVPLAQLLHEAEWARKLHHALVAAEPELVAVAREHARATAAGEDPLAAVAQLVGVSKTTAAIRVREARAAGLMPPRTRYGKRGKSDNDQMGSSNDQTGSSG